MAGIIDIAKLLAARQIKFGKGEIRLLNQKVGLFPIKAIINLEKELYRRNLQNLVYYAVKDMAHDWFFEMNKSYKIKIEDIQKWGESLWSLAGLGNVELLIDVKNKILKGKTMDGFESLAFGNVGMEVDQFPRGATAGTASFILGIDCDAIEVKCQSKGDEHCEFIAQPAEKWDRKNKIVKEQLYLPK